MIQASVDMNDVGLQQRNTVQCIKTPNGVNQAV